MQSPKILHWTWHSIFWRKLNNKLMAQRKHCTISCRKTVHKQPYSRHLFSTKRPLYCISQYFFFYWLSYRSLLYILIWHGCPWKKLNNYLLTVDIYRKNIKSLKMKKKTTTKYFQVEIDYIVSEILWNIRVYVSCNFKTTMEAREETNHAKVCKTASISVHLKT